MRLTLLLLLLVSPVWAQWTLQSVGTTASFRAVSAVSEQVVWVGGSGGTFLRTTDGGQTWHTGRVPSAEACDFRDVEGIDAQTAVLMSAGPAEQGQARFYRTTDGGKTWTLTYQTSQPGVFFDGMAFWNTRRGIAFSDPVAGKYVLLQTSNGGLSWQPITAPQGMTVNQGEAAFAASGSSIAVHGSRHVWIGSGGVGGGRVFRSVDGGQSWAVAATGLPADSSRGVFGVYFKNEREGMVVGGDYRNEKKPGLNVALTRDGGQTWAVSSTGPAGGLKEGVIRLANGHWVLVGPSGTNLSTDEGKTWQLLDTEAFHALSCRGNTCWAVGANGRVGRRTF
ncbi:WD40/YVTN/BNR-like repeat-containing protein [Rudanella lutea]|uniref:WD40/YVTN/BNR-like repeat-containing protein n=1 Tax=Rudanella lutea TaxID=451374 RepID=UPI000486F9A0|nr:oxidoreductase [Rudanella lutea]